MFQKKSCLVKPKKEKKERKTKTTITQGKKKKKKKATSRKEKKKKFGNVPTHNHSPGKQKINLKKKCKVQ